MVDLGLLIEYSEEELKNEIWLPCVGYEGKYMVSNLGRVKSLPFVYEYNNGKSRHIFEGIKKMCESGKKDGAKQGYLCTRMMDENGKSSSNMIHTLVAKAFIPNPDNLPTVNHKDGNKHNNRVNNLEWASYSKNNQHAMDNNLKTDTQTIIRVFNDYIIGIYVSISNASLQTEYTRRQLYKFLNTGIKDDYGCYWYRYEPNTFKCFKTN